MKIFFIQDTLANAGAEKSLLNILPYFSKDIFFTVVYLYPRHDLLDEYNAANIPVVFLQLDGKYDFWNGYSKLRSLLKAEEPDIVVSVLMRANLLARTVCKSLGIPLVGSLVSDSYNEVVLKNRSFIRSFKFKVFWGLDRISAQVPKFYISNSQFIASSHKSTLGIPLKKTRVVYRGRVIPEKVWVNPYTPVYTFLSYGRLLEIKGFEELIHAFAKVHLTFPNSRLLIYGEGLHRPVLEKLLYSLDLRDVILLPGEIGNVTEQLYLADCFVFPSWYEGFSGALVEAMMSGIPIIASDIPMNLEAITAEESALVFAVRDVDSLVRQMTYALLNPAEMSVLGRKARETAINRFDIKIIAKQYEAVLREAYFAYCKQ